MSFTVLAMVVLGGMGNMWGVAIGAFIIYIIQSVLLKQLNIFFDTVQVPILSDIDFLQYQFLLYGIALVAMMLLRPEGLFPSRRRAAELHTAVDCAGADAEGIDRSGPSAGATRHDGGTGSVAAPPRRRRHPRSMLRAQVRSPSASAAWWRSTSAELVIPKGSIVSLIGPNGAGKTTFFNVVAGILDPSSGEIEFRGRKMVAGPSARGWSRSCGSSRVC